MGGKIRHVATLPDGRREIRRSKFYNLACVAVGPRCRDAYVASLKRNEHEFKYIEKLEFAIANPKLVCRDRGFKHPEQESPYETHEVFLDGLPSLAIPCSSAKEVMDFGGLLGNRGAITPALPHCIALALHAIHEAQARIAWSEAYKNSISLGPERIGESS